jgi:hypothetical protein
METSTNLIACPVAGCLSFPWTTQAEVDAHVASGQHVMDLAPRRNYAGVSVVQGTSPRHGPRPSSGGAGGRGSIQGQAAPTEKQTAFLRSLLAEREGVQAAELVRATLNAHRENGTLSKAVVSTAIGHLLDIPKATVKAGPVAEHRPGNVDLSVLEGLPAGRYFVAETFVRVDRPAKGNWAGFVFVKRQPYGPDTDGVRCALLNPAAGTAKVDEGYRHLLDALLEDPKAAAVEFGHRTGSCCVCGRTLTDPESIAKGIGPICEGRF